ncbi:transposase [Aeromonas enteropelogenes]|nr:transposase [Aeromonas enteropelogenes]BEE22984.1 transposase [Aeromonas enteropelogenes]
MTGCRQQEPRIGLTKCPDLVDHYTQFPSRSLIGRPTRETRQVLDGILWILHTGAPWRDLPERFGPWNSVYNTFRRWQDAGRIDAILEALQLKLNEEGLIDFDLWCLDGSNVRASKDAAGARKKTPQ